MDKRCWVDFFFFSFSTVGGRLLFICDFESSVTTYSAPPFYLEIVKTWLDIEKYRHLENDAVNPIIFNNTNIRIAGMMFFIQRFIRGRDK